jgi:hypothetical protein
MLLSVLEKYKTPQGTKNAEGRRVVIANSVVWGDVI